MKIAIPENAKLILDILNNAGFDAFVVGGCVRDSLMGKTPTDWDITTSATPEKTLEIFSQGFKVVPTGLKHGTVTVIVGGEPFEITTFRTEGEYKDSRRPETVEFVDDITLDLSRRDFTINAMAYNEKKGFVDVFGGRDHTTIMHSCKVMENTMSRDSAMKNLVNTVKNRVQNAK